MDINDVIKQIKVINKEVSLKSLEKTEHLLRSYMKNDRNDIELLIRLAILQLYPPLSDEIKCIEYLEQILEFDEANEKALIILGFVKEWRLCGLDKVLLEKLINLDVANRETASMINYILGWHYLYKDAKLFEKYLENSISLYPYHVNNFIDLGKHYINIGKMQVGRNLLKTAIKNIRHVFTTDEIFIIPTDITSPDDFINENIKGIYITEDNLNSLRNILIE